MRKERKNRDTCWPPTALKTLQLPGQEKPDRTENRYGAPHSAAPASIIDPRYVNGSGVRRAPSGFSLAAKPPGACTPAHNRVEPPILIVLDQNRKTAPASQERSTAIV